jgi:hypothetical protein
VTTSFLLRNQSRTIESLLTSLGFLVTIIVSDDSLNKIFSPKKNKMPRYLFLFPIEWLIFNRSPRCPGVTEWRLLWGLLGLSFTTCLFIAKPYLSYCFLYCCYVVFIKFLFFIFCPFYCFSMHNYSCLSCIYIGGLHALLISFLKLYGYQL